MRYKKKDINVFTRSTDGIIDMQIKSCSGKRVLNNDNPHKLPNYTNLSISGSVKMGYELEEFLVDIAMNHDIVMEGQAFIFAGQLYDLNLEEVELIKKFISERAEETPDDVAYINKSEPLTPSSQEDKRD
jgi:hypothetical protein